MKKIVLGLFDLFLVFCMVVNFALINEYSKEYEVKLVKSDLSRIVSSSTLSDSEKELLDSNLRQNNNVLLLFYETAQNIDNVTEKLIVGNYTKEDVPYVIFVYNNQAKTLKSSSSSKEFLDFNDISLENVSSYTEVYKYISGIHSKLMVPMLSQNKGILYMLIIAQFLGIIYISIITSQLLESIRSCKKWKEGFNYMYQENFLETCYKIKVKSDNDNKDIIKVLTNVPLKKGKDYFIIRKYTRNKDLKTFIIVGKYISQKYTINKYGSITSQLVHDFSKEDFKYTLLPHTNECRLTIES